MATKCVELISAETSANSDTENGWSDGFEEEDTDCEDDGVEHSIARYKD